MNWKEEYDSLKFQEANMNTLTFELTTAQDDDRAVYLTGNFNDWRVGEATYQMTKIGYGAYHYVFEENTTLPKPLQYKYVKGTWKDVEADEFGCDTHHRTVEANKGVVKDKVPRWKKEGIAYNPQYLPQIELVTEGEDIPQLRRKRKIWIVLPHNYHQTKQYYPVIYLHDAQNLFDEHAPFGNWAIDKTLSVLSEKGKGGVIVVAIEHAGQHRLIDFNPIVNKEKQQEGIKYIKFVANYLKPYIDERYRTLPSRENTGIGGSSLGGLVSLYGILNRPEVFGKALVFSPSLWIAPAAYLDATTFLPQTDSKIYLYGGGKESDYMLNNIHRLKESFDWNRENVKNLQVLLATDMEGHHNEERWGKEFPKAIEWLFGN
ncbi:MAG: alpha/beta hydrolase-fold protein [Chitinophagales bacterium]